MYVVVVSVEGGGVYEEVVSDEDVVTHELPFQYWSDGHDVEEDELEVDGIWQ